MIVLLIVLIGIIYFLTRLLSNCIHMSNKSHDFPLIDLIGLWVLIITVIIVLPASADYKIGYAILDTFLVAL